MNQSKLLLCQEMTERSIDSETYLFVCTGNTCRSPMAEALFNHICADASRHAASCGIAADGSPISEKAKLALMERGVLPTPENDYLHHVSRTVTEKMLSDASAIICMTGSHAMALIMRYPTYTSKITVMPREISDPYGGTLDDYKKCLADIEAALTETFLRTAETDEKPNEN